MKVLLLSITSILFFILNSENNIIGTWKINLYVVNNDTIYKENFPEFTQQYFNKTLSSIDDSEEKELKIIEASENLIKNINSVSLKIDKKAINSFNVSDFQNRIKIKYTIEKNIIILDKKQNEKYKYILEYDSLNEKIILQDEAKFLKVEYIRLN